MPPRGEQYWVDSVAAVLHTGVYLHGTLRFPDTKGRCSQFILCRHWVTPASDLLAEVSQETLSKSHYFKKKLCPQSISVSTANPTDGHPDLALKLTQI